MVRTQTLYNELWVGHLPLTRFEVPDALKRRRAKGRYRMNKRLKGRSIGERPAVVEARTELGHWEADMVVGLRTGKEAVFFALLRR